MFSFMSFFYQERQQLREMEDAREAEERALREAARRENEQYGRERLDRMNEEREARVREEMNRMDRYGRLQFSPTNPYQPEPSKKPPPPIKEKPKVPPPPQRNSSYGMVNDHTYRPGSAGGGQYEPSQPANNLPRSVSASALKSADNGQAAPSGGAKKSVSFNANLATEIDYRYDSTSSQNSSTYGGSTSSYPSTSSYDPRNASTTGGYDAPTTPTTPGANDVFNHVRTPDNSFDMNYTTGSTPGVIGAQEVYRDPRDRIAANRPDVGHRPVPERMSFRDKMKMFATEAGENTPEEKPKVSRAQRQIELGLNGRH